MIKTVEHSDAKKFEEAVNQAMAEGYQIIDISVVQDSNMDTWNGNFYQTGCAMYCAILLSPMPDAKDTTNESEAILNG